MLDTVLYLALGINKQLNNCFGKIREANMLIWADSASWTGLEVLTVLGEWYMALVTVLVEVERLKMVVVCQSTGTLVTCNASKET